MPNYSLTLRLSGDVYLDDFVTAISELRSLVRALGREVAGGTEIEWSVEALEAGSAATTFRGLAREENRQPQVEEIVRAYERVGSSLESGSDLPYGKEVVEAARGVTNILNGRIDEILFETEETEAVITNTVVSPEKPARTAVFAYGAIEGRVQTLSSRTGLRFTLYDAFGRGIPCYLRSGYEDMMRDAWNKWVVVEGKVRRDGTGKPVSVREITDVAVREPGEPGDYRSARGALRVGPDTPSPEEAIRRLRDA